MDTNTRQVRGYIDNGTNNSTGNIHHRRVAGYQQVLTILAGILLIIFHGSQQTARRLCQTGSQAEQQQQVGVAGPAKTNIMEGMDTSSG
jgi:hypothetical protein